MLYLVISLIIISVVITAEIQLTNKPVKNWYTEQSNFNSIWFETMDNRIIRFPDGDPNGVLFPTQLIAPDIVPVTHNTACLFSRIPQNMNMTLFLTDGFIITNNVNIQGKEGYTYTLQRIFHVNKGNMRHLFILYNDNNWITGVAVLNLNDMSVYQYQTNLTGHICENDSHRGTVYCMLGKYKNQTLYKFDLEAKTMTQEYIFYNLGDMYNLRVLQDHVYISTPAKVFRYSIKERSVALFYTYEKTDAFVRILDASSPSNPNQVILLTLQLTIMCQDINNCYIYNTIANDGIYIAIKDRLYFIEKYKNRLLGARGNEYVDILVNSLHVPMIDSRHSLSFFNMKYNQERDEMYIISSENSGFKVYKYDFLSYNFRSGKASLLFNLCNDSDGKCDMLGDIYELFYDGSIIYEKSINGTGYVYRYQFPEVPISNAALIVGIIIGIFVSVVLMTFITLVIILTLRRYRFEKLRRFRRLATAYESL
jgi:hypothetical protein